MGLLFGWVFRRSQSLYPGMALHALWNFLVLCRELAG
jgi:membrane protease YdiL (CAAX protease family)